LTLELEEAFRMILKVSRVLERLGVPWVTVGSIASSIHGIPRTTEDIDLVARLEPSHVSSLVEALQDEFYLDQERIHSAIRRGSSFNLIHLETLVKIDVDYLHQAARRLGVEDLLERALRPRPSGTP